MLYLICQRPGSSEEHFWERFEVWLEFPGYRNADCFAPVHPVSGKPWTGSR